jgi:hypothetical protein
MKNEEKMKKNSAEKGKIIWKDQMVIKIVSIIISLVGILFGLFLFFYIAKKYIERLWALLVVVIGIIATYSELIKRLSHISMSGVLIGNLPLKRWNSLTRRKREFLRWNEIKYIILRNHEVKVSRGSWARTFILIRTKNNKKYECVVYDPQGFIQALKKLNKDYLFKDKKKLYEKYGIE